MRFSFKNIFLISFFFLSFVSSAYADLFITPLRVVFDGRDRSALVTLINRSDTTNTYRIFWQDKKFNGKNYDDVETLSVANGGASEMIRYSPRQITLKPGEKQKIRLALRKPGDLPVGEYRSHLTFQKVPEKRSTEKDESVHGANVKLYVNLSFAIPIFVRQGITNDTVTAKMSDLSLTKDAQTGKPQLKLTISKNAPQTAFGKLLVYNMEQGAQEGNVVGLLNNVSILKENNQRDFAVNLDAGPITGNRLYVVYKGSDEYQGVTWDEQIINLN